MDEAWELTRRVSPRDYVQVAPEAVGGLVPNVYPTARRIDDAAPAAPWAMWLTSAPGRYAFLCFDLDAGKGNARYDAGRLCHWLDELAIAHLRCTSGPAGGQHVWIGLDHAADGRQIALIGKLAAQLLPSLDTSCLSASGGAARPPGAPHRAGGQSEPHGSTRVLEQPTTTPADLDALESLLLELGAELPSPVHLTGRGILDDVDGHPYVVGTRRALSARMQAMLASPPAADTSHTMTQLLTAAANAHWRYADIEALARTAPALEHARTRPHGLTRRPRGAVASERLLERAWAAAVAYVAAQPSTRVGVDDTFPARENAVAAAVSAAQGRADATPGLWGHDRASRAHRAHRGSPSHRAVLDALCGLMLRAVSLEVDADLRRLATATGYSHEAVRLALRALATPTVDGDPDSAWITRATAGTRRHGDRFRLSAKFSTEKMTSGLTQVHTPPLPRLHLLRQLEVKLASGAQDVFAAPRSLGRTAGTLYSRLRETPAALRELARNLGLSAQAARRGLERLHRHGLANRSTGGWAVGATGTDVAAVAIGVDGYLEARSRSYAVDRVVWAWWCKELEWMQAQGRKRRRRPADQLPLVNEARFEATRYPRRRGRAHHIDARRICRAAGAGLVVLRS